MDKKMPAAAVLLAALLWGTTGTAQALAPNTASPLAFGAVRVLAGGLFLAAYSLCRRRLNLRGLPVMPLLISALAMALYQPLFFTAVRHTGIAVGTVVTLASAPVMTGILEWLVYGRRPSAAWRLATLCAIAGACLLFSGRLGGEASVVGLLMAAGAGSTFAFYTLASKRLLAQHNAETAASAVFCLSGLMLSPLLLAGDLSWLVTLNGAAAALHIGIAATGIAYLLFTSGLQKLPASSAVTLSMAEPVTASLLGVLVIGESLTPLAWLGLALLLLGIGVLALRPGNAGQRAGRQPAAIQPAAIQPVAIRPVAIQPVALQPAAIQPAARQPVARQSLDTTPDRFTD